MKAKEPHYETITEAIDAAEMKNPIDGEIAPADRDWHRVVSIRGTGYHVDAAFYTGEFWTLGNEMPDKARPVEVYQYDADILFPADRGGGGCAKRVSSF